MNNTLTKNENWEELKLQKIGAVVTGKTPSQDNPEYWGDVLDFITPTDIKTSSKYLTKTARLLSREGRNAFNRLIIPAYSVVVTCIGSDMGKVIINKNECLANQQINSIIVNKDFDIDFVYYLLKNSYKILRLNAEGVGSTMPIINKSSFENLVFRIPTSINEQRSISLVLSALDNKIELLKKQNETLEQIARVVFSEWFVEFNFPNEKGKLYKMSGGKMIKSELGEIPEGWKVGMIKNLIDIFSGYAFKSVDFNAGGKYGLVTIKNVQSGYFVEQTTDRLVSIPNKMPKYCQLKTGDILLSLTGNVGRICYVVGDNYFLNQRVAKIKAKNEKDFAFSYVYFRQETFLETLENVASGTAQQNLSPIKTGELDMIIPSRLILDNFSNIVNPMINKMFQNSLQIQQLTSIRDTFLPKLMSGDLRVK